MTTTEQEVDFAAIRVGDKVKLRYHGLESTDWHEVIRLDVTGGIHVGAGAGDGDWYVAEGGEVAVIAHQPAPRKVEVTLGAPLDNSPREYSGIDVSAGSSVKYRRPDVFISSLGFAALPPSAARRLALDILATVGVDD
jgi:hypothetical protein